MVRLAVSVALALVALSPVRALADADPSLELDLANAGIPLVPVVSAASLQDPLSPPDEAPPPPDANPWHVTLIPAFWVPVVFEGTVDVGPVRTDIDLDISELLDGLDFAIEGGIALTNDDWSFLFYGSYFKLGADVTSQQPLSVAETDMDYELTILDFAVGKRIARGPMGNGEWRVDLLGGLRYWEQEVEIKQSDPIGFDPMIDRRDDWVDLFIGGRIILDVTDTVALWFRGDVGGFSIGSSADLTWTLTGMFELKLSDTWFLVAGYRYVKLDWDKGSRPRRIEYDYDLHGPIIGASIRF
jgi:opacity protein-like surface antigen